MVEYVTIYHFYRTAMMRGIRLLLFALVLVVIWYQYQLSPHTLPKFALFVLNSLVIVELFFHYKISRAMPTVPVSKNTGKDIYESFTRDALYGFVIDPTVSGVMKRLIKYPQVKLLLQKVNITHKDLPMTDVSKELLAQSALDAAKTFKATYVTTIDVFVAYLFLIEKDTKLLFAKQLKIEDLYNILYWVRLEYPEEEHPKKFRVHVEGEGFGEDLMTGWTPETKKYTRNFTIIATRDIPLIRGREAEFKALLEGLLRVENNNVLLVGDTGAGKENLVKAIAYHSLEGNIGGYLNNRRIFELMVGPLIAGAGNRSDLEVRLQNIIAEVSHAREIILYIPEFQEILGGTAYNINLAGALLPYLQGGVIPIVASMTTGSYKTFMDRNPLKQVFTVVPLKEPEKNAVIQMVLSESTHIERKYKVILSYLAIGSAVEFASRFFHDKVLPGSAVSLLETVANAVSLSKDAPYYDQTRKKIVLKDHVIRKVEETTHVAIGTPTKQEIDLLLHLEQKLHERVIDQDEAVTAIAESMRRVRSGVLVAQRPISFLFLGPTGVGKTETAKALADLYYGGEKNMIRLDMSEYTDETGLRRLLGAPPGQGEERGELTEKIRDNPSSLVLLDEFEKAYPPIHNLFLQVLDDGRLTDNKGETVSFRNAIIIATSNAASDFIREAVEKGTKIDKKFQHQLLEQVQTQNIFKPELLNRFDEVITFKPLLGEQVPQVVKLLLQKLTDTMAEQDINLVFDAAVIEKIGREGMDTEFGARPLRRYIQDTVEDIIAQKKLTNELTRGKTATFFINGTGALDVSIT